ncbi:MAG: SET domain-containing protein [Bacteroidetes bacterium]|nr:SET domain-containing protein [Bacteroidota bacterium]
MLHPHAELRHTGNPHIGWGVFATQLIPRGTITWVFDELDLVLSPAALEAIHSPALQELARKYSYRDDQDRYVLSWDHAKYVNHSCNANTLSPVTSFEIAVRDIQPGEEITDDYGYLRLERAFTCGCGSTQCRGTVSPEDEQQLQEHWANLLAAPLKQMAAVPQPLLAYAHPEALQDIERYLSLARVPR